MKTSSIIAIIMVFVTQNSLSANTPKDNLIAEDIVKFEQGQLENLVLTQYYRWFLAFESEQRPSQIDQHLSLLTDDVNILTSAGPLKGTEGVKSFLNYVKPWQNAHHVGSVDVREQADGSIALNAEIEYQNILPDGKANAFLLKYKTKLKSSEASVLPIFTDLELLPVETLAEPEFEDAYAKNRALSFVHYWSYLIDHVEGNEAVIKSLLAPTYTVNFDPENTLTTEAQIDQWLGFMKSGFSEMLHKPVDIQVIEKAVNQYQVSFNYHWQGFTADGERQILKTQHRWLLLNNPDEDFPKLADLDMTVIQPFTKVDRFSID